MIEAVVIGGGQAGLGVSHHLRRAGVEHVVLERGRVGETWRSQRWDSFALNTPSWMNRLPGLEEGQPRDGFLSGEQFVGLLEGYARRFELPVRTESPVTSVDLGPDRRSFVVRTGGARGDELETRSVVVASGMQRVPRIPPHAARLPAAITQLHSAEYRRPDQLPAGAVVVVGSAQSGGQIAEDLLDAGRTVYVCTSTVARVRRRYRGHDMLERLAAAGFFDQRPEQLPDPAMQFAAQPIISGVGRYGHTLSLQFLAARGAILLGRLRDVGDGRLILDDTVGRDIRFGDEKSAEFRQLIDEGLRTAGIDAPPPEPDEADEPHPDPDSVRSPGTLDLDAAGVGTVIWATGVGGEFGWLRLPVLDDRGSPVHLHGVAAVAGLYFLGLPWLTRRKSGIIFGVDEDAAMIANQVRQHLSGRAA